MEWALPPRLSTFQNNYAEDFLKSTHSIKPRRTNSLSTEGFQNTQSSSLATTLNAKLNDFFSKWYIPAIKFIDKSKEVLNSSNTSSQNSIMRQVNQILYFYYDTDTSKSFITRAEPIYDETQKVRLTYFIEHTKNIYNNTLIVNSNLWKDAYKYMRILCTTGTCDRENNINLACPIIISLFTTDGLKIPITDKTYFDITYDTESIIIYNKKNLYFSGYDWVTEKRTEWTVQGSNDDIVFNLRQTNFIDYVNNLKVDSPSWITMDSIVGASATGKSRPYSRVVMMRDIDSASKLIMSAILEQYKNNYNSLTDDIRQQLLCGSSIARDNIVINDPKISFKEVEILHKKYVSDPNSCIKNMRKILIKTIVKDKTSLESIYNTCKTKYNNDLRNDVWFNIVGNSGYDDLAKNILGNIFTTIENEYKSAVDAEANAAKRNFGISTQEIPIAESDITFPRLVSTYTKINYTYRHIKRYLLATPDPLSNNSASLPNNITNDSFEPKTVPESTFADILISKVKLYINNKLILYRDLVYYTQNNIESSSSNIAIGSPSSSTESISLLSKYKIPVPYFEYYPDSIKAKFVGSSPEIVSDYNRLWASRSIDELIKLNNTYEGYIVQIIEEKKLQELRINTIYQMKLFEDIYKNVIAFAPDIINYIDVPSSAARDNELKNIVAKLRDRENLENIRKKYEGYIYKNIVADGYRPIDKSLIAALNNDVSKKLTIFKNLYETTYNVTKNGTPITVVLNQYKLSSCVDPTIDAASQCMSPNTFGDGINEQTPGCGNCSCCDTAKTTFFATKDAENATSVINDYNTFKTKTNNFASGNIGDFETYLNTIISNKIDKIPDNIEASASRKAYDSTITAFNSFAADYNKIASGIQLLGTTDKNDPTYASGYIGMAMTSIDSDINSSVIRTVIQKLKELNDVLIATNIPIEESKSAAFSTIVNTPSALLPTNYDTIVYNAWMTTDEIYKLNTNNYTDAKVFTATQYADDLTAIQGDPTYVSNTAESKYFGTTSTSSGANNCKTYIILTSANNLYIDILNKINIIKNETGEANGISIDSSLFTITNYKTIANGNTIIRYINQLKSALTSKISEYANEFIRAYKIEAAEKATAVVKLKSMYSIYTSIMENITKVYSTESTYSQPEFLQGRYIRIDRTAAAWANDATTEPYIINLNGIQIFDEKYEEIALTEDDIKVRSTYNNLDKYNKKYLIKPIPSEESIGKTEYEYMYASAGDSSTAYDWIEIDLRSNKKISKIVVKNRVNIFASTSGYVQYFRKRIKNLKLSIYKDVTRTAETNTSGPLYAEGGLVYSDSSIFNSRVQMYYTFNLFADRTNETTPIQLPPSVLSRMVKGRSFIIKNELNETPLNIYSIEIYDQFGKVYTDTSSITVTASSSLTDTQKNSVFYEYGNENNTEPSNLTINKTDTSPPFINITFNDDVYISRVVINHKPLTGDTKNTLEFSRVEIQDSLGNNLCNFSCKYSYESSSKSMYGNMLTARLVLYTLDVPLKPNNSQSYCENLPYYNYTIMDGISTKTESTPVSECTVSNKPNNTNILTDIVAYYKDTVYWNNMGTSAIKEEIKKLDCKTVSAINAVLDYRNMFVSTITEYWKDMTSTITESTATKYFIRDEIKDEFDAEVDAFEKISADRYITSLIDSEFRIIQSSVISANTLIQTIKDEHVAMIKAMFKFRNAASNKFNFRYVETTVAADKNTNQLAKINRVATIDISDSKYSMFNTMDWLIVGAGGSGAINQTSGGGGGGSGAFKSTQLGGFFGTKYETIQAYNIYRDDKTYTISYKPDLTTSDNPITLESNTTLTITVGNGGILTDKLMPDEGDQTFFGQDGGSTIIKQGTEEKANAAGGWGGGKNATTTTGGRAHVNKGGDKGTAGNSYFGGTGGNFGTSVIITQTATFRVNGQVNRVTSTTNTVNGAGGGGGGVGFGNGGVGDSRIKTIYWDGTPGFFMDGTPGSGDSDSGAGGGGGYTGSAGAGGTGYAVVAFSTTAFEFPENLNKYLLPTKLEYYTRISPSNVISNDPNTAAEIYKFIWRRLNIVPPLSSAISYTAGTTTYTELGSAIVSYCNANPRTCFKNSERLTIIATSSAPSPAPSPTISSGNPTSSTSPFQNQNPYNESEVRKRITLQKLNALNLQLDTNPSITRQVGASVEGVMKTLYSFFGLA